MKRTTISHGLLAFRVNERLTYLANGLKDKQARASFLARQLKMVLAAQIRSLRGDLSQKEFGELIGKPQSVVSRLESEEYGRVNVQTLLDVAIKSDVALLVRFVDYPTFLGFISEHASDVTGPKKYSEEAIEEFVSSSKSSALAMVRERSASYRAQSGSNPLGSFFDKIVPSSNPKDSVDSRNLYFYERVYRRQPITPIATTDTEQPSLLGSFEAS